MSRYDGPMADDYRDQLDEALGSVLRWISWAAREASFDPETLVAMTGALKALHDVHVTERVLDARRRGQGAELGQVVPFKAS